MIKNKREGRSANRLAGSRNDNAEDDSPASETRSLRGKGKEDYIIKMGNKRNRRETHNARPRSNNLEGCEREARPRARHVTALYDTVKKPKVAEVPLQGNQTPAIHSA